MTQMGLPQVLSHTMPIGQEPHFSFSPCLSSAGRGLVSSSIAAVCPLVLDSDSHIASAVWLWPSVITMNLASDVGPWMNLSASWPALLPGWSGGTSLIWRSPALPPPWGPHHSQPPTVLILLHPSTGASLCKANKRTKAQKDIAHFFLVNSFLIIKPWSWWRNGHHPCEEWHRNRCRNSLTFLTKLLCWGCPH